MKNVKILLTSFQKTAILVTLMFGTFITGMTVTVTTVMLPAIMADYQIPPSTAQWLTSGATLVSGIMIPIAAFLIKRLPSKQYYLIAIAVFCMGALLGALSENFPILLLGRFVQAIGCGMLMSFAQVVLMTIYPRSHHGSVMGIYALGSTAAAVMAPSLAGLIIDYFGWQTVFVLLLCAGIICFVLGCLFMRNVTEVCCETFPVMPIFLSSIGFFGILVGFSNLNQSIMRPESGGALCVGILALTVFTITQLKAPVPFLDLRIFRHYTFRAAVLISISMYLVVMGSGFLLPVYVQSILGNSATVFALITLPGSVVMACTSVYAGKLYDKIGFHVLFRCGGLLLLLGSISGLLFGRNTNLLQIGITSCLMSAGTGFLNTPATTMAISGMEGRERVDGSSILNTLRQIASALAATLVVLVYTLISRVSNDITGIRSAYLFFLVISMLILIFVRNLSKTKSV